MKFCVCDANVIFVPNKYYLIQHWFAIVMAKCSTAHFCPYTV